ncbi:hypothetical protein TrVE_jg11210 [Triparma verrucosa]|uniref:Uncharacterized protein n=1 Tax=Triparma verrucosa TaxID=1606542 RepID=A0A9W7F7F3_9STRA|nr:hypothetical protein TrVE_jg11210 [Triparma verrucosa]
MKINHPDVSTSTSSSSITSSYTIVSSPSLRWHYMTSYIKNNERDERVRDGVLEKVMEVRGEVEEEGVGVRREVEEEVKGLTEEIKREYDDKNELERDIVKCIEIANEGVFYWRCWERIKEME